MHGDIISLSMKLFPQFNENNNHNLLIVDYSHVYLKSKLSQTSLLLYLLDVTNCKTNLCMGIKK